MITNLDLPHMQSHCQLSWQVSASSVSSLPFKFERNFGYLENLSWSLCHVIILCHRPQASMNRAKSHNFVHDVANSTLRVPTNGS